MAMLRNALLYFDQAARDGSIRKAAENLHIASSAINRQLLQLEYEFDVELFIRLPRGIRPTAAGESLLAFIRRNKHEELRLKQDIANLKGGLHGTIRVAAAESIIEAILPSAIALLKEKHPLIDFNLISGDNYKIREKLFTKEVDIVCTFDVPTGYKGTSVTSINTDIGVIMAKGHPLSLLDNITLQDCAGYPIVAPAIEWLAHSTIREILEKQKTPMQIVARVERISSLKKLVEAGIGIAFLSKIGLDNDVLEWRPLPKSVAKPAIISLIVESGRIQPTYISTFIEILINQLQGLENNI